MRRLIPVFLLFSITTCAEEYPDRAEGDFIIRDFQFQAGEKLSELRLHYTTIGTAVKDASGLVRNAVLLLHGTGGAGDTFIKRQAFSGQLFGPGQLLDARTHYIVMPDNIGHGRSSKPSDGLRTRFPKYGYQDMVLAQYRLLTERLGVNRLRLILGTSMGCMHSWIWGSRYPGFMDALMPLACLPYPITGRNYLWRRMDVDLIRSDSGYQGGDYQEQPKAMRGASHIITLMTSNTLDLQKRGGTRDEAEKLYQDLFGPRANTRDANDFIYQVESSWDYDPRPGLPNITAPIFAINFADDAINPPELGIFEREVKKAPRAKYLSLPASTETRGHGTHSMPIFWKQYLAQLLSESEPH